MSVLETGIGGRELIAFATEDFSLPTSAGAVIVQVLDVASAGYAAKEVIIVTVAVAGLCVKHHPAGGIRCTQRRTMSDMLLL